MYRRAEKENSKVLIICISYSAHVNHFLSADLICESKNYLDKDSTASRVQEPVSKEVLFVGTLFLPLVALDPPQLLQN